jgi:hypothetical protein
MKLDQRVYPLKKSVVVCTDSDCKEGAIRTLMYYVPENTFYIYRTETYSFIMASPFKEILEYWV